MRDGFDAKMCRERDLEWGEQETSEAGAKKAYATLVRDQGSKVNCFNLTFFFNRVYTFAASAIASSNHVLEQAFLAKIYDESSKNQTEILDGHSETLLTLPVRLMVLSVLSTPLGSSSFNLPNV